MANSILLIVPDSRARGQLAVILREIALDVMAVPDPFAAMRRLEEQPFVAVIVERELPGVNGLEYIQNLAANYPEIPVALLTDAAEAESTPPTAQLGVKEILFKPFRPAAIIKKIGRLVEATAEAAPSTNVPDTEAPGSSGNARTVDPFARVQQSSGAKVPAARGLTHAPFQAEAKISYSPRYLVARSPQARRFVRNLWAARNFRRALLLEGEPGSEFEIAVRELHHACGSDGFPHVLEGWEVEEDTLRSLEAKAALHAEPLWVFISEVNLLTPEAGDVLEAALERGSSQSRENLRFVLGWVDEGDPPPEKTVLYEVAEHYSENHLKLPPLRDRGPDIPELVRQTLYGLVSLHSFVRVRGIEAAALDYLQKQVWPGNFDQLVTVLRSAAANCPYRNLSVSQLESYMHSGLAASHLAESMTDAALLTNNEV